MRHKTMKLPENAQLLTPSFSPPDTVRGLFVRFMFIAYGDQKLKPPSVPLYLK